MRSASAPPSAEPSPGPVPPLAWSAIGVCFMAMFFVMGTRSAFGVLYPHMVADMGWSVAEVTGAFSAGLFVYAPMAIVAGMAVDRFGCRAAMLVGSTILALGMLVVATAGELWQLYVGFVLTNGLAAPGIGFITCVKLLSLRARPRFATAFGVAFTGQGVGSLVLSPTIEAVAEAAGWRIGAVAIAVMVVAVLVPLAALFAPGPERPAEARHATDDVPKEPGALIFVVFLLSNAGLGYLMLIPTHQVAFLLDLGFASATAAAAAGAWGAMTSVGSLAGGWVLERWGLHRMLIAAFLAFAVGTTAVIFGGPAAAWLIVAYVLTSGLGRGLLSVVLGSAQTRVYAGPRLGRVTGLMDVGFGTGAFLGPWLTAVVHDAAGTFAPGFLSAIGSALLMATMAALATRLTRSLPSRQV